MQGEVWRGVVGYEEHYQVSNYGRVRSLPRFGGTYKRVYGGNVLTGHAQSNSGYESVSLSVNRERIQKSVHTLVAEAFHGPASNGQVCCHNDGNKLNNSAANLRWDTQSGNQRDRLLHGTSNRGSAHGNAKLCELDAWIIKNIGFTCREVGEFFGVSPTAISAIRRGRTWTHVDRAISERTGVSVPWPTEEQL